MQRLTSTLGPQPSADVILSSAHNAFQHASTRFATFVGFVDSLIVLYASSPSRGVDVALLRDVRQSFEKRMTVVEVPSVVELRTAEVHFRMLSIDQQVQAVSNGRALLFNACSEVHALQPLPDAHQIVRPPLHSPFSPCFLLKEYDLMCSHPPAAIRAPQRPGAP